MKRKPANVAEETGEPSAKKPRKLGITIGVVAAIAIAASVGGWIWHESPSFCGAICHTPMDPYLATYEEEPIKGATDKYGNTVDGSTMFAAVHRVSGETTCLDCHEPTLSQQIGEGISWITGSYEVTENEAYGVVIDERSLTDLASASGKTAEQFCLNDSCHADTTTDDLAELTSYMKRNVHDQSEAPHGKNAECGDCHKAHTQSVVTCTQCHADSTVPSGWMTNDEYKKLHAS